jgi:meiotically up-regulated gene 157 (Mug157) protein
MREQQRKDSDGPYRFERVNRHATETLMLKGVGAPTRKVGLIHSMFRPSDDACTLPFLIPSNLFAVAALRMLAQIHTEARSDAAAAAACTALADEVDAALTAHGRMDDGAGNQVWAFETDGFGNSIFMDDANVPSLSALPCWARRGVTIRSICAPARSHGARATPISSPGPPPRGSGAAQGPRHDLADVDHRARHDHRG